MNAMPGPAQGTALLRRQIASLALAAGAASYQVDGAPSTHEEVAVEGEFRLLKLRSGLILHTADIRECQALRSRVDAGPSLTISLVLSGRVDIWVGGMPLTLGPEAPAAQGRVESVMMACARADVFERRTVPGARVRKVVLTVEPEWWDSAGSGVPDAVARFVKRHLAIRRWRPSRRMLGLAEDMLRPRASPPWLAQLELESRAIDMVGDAFAALAQQDGRGRGASAQDLKRVQRVLEALESPDEGPPTLCGLAAQACMSPSALQRLFRHVFGVSVIQYVRRRALEQSRCLLEQGEVTIAEAAFAAGYSSTANFATAFRRLHGFPPGAACPRSSLRMTNARKAIPPPATAAQAPLPNSAR